MSINNNAEKKRKPKNKISLLDRWLHFKDGCLKTKMTLKRDALIATKMSSCHPAGVQP